MTELIATPLRWVGDGTDLGVVAVGVLRAGDETGAIDRLIARQLAAEEAFRKSSYAAWPLFPKHPAAPALAAFRKHLSGQRVDHPERPVASELPRDDFSFEHDLAGGRNLNVDRLATHHF